jgi:hypothetical protein
MKQILVITLLTLLLNTTSFAQLNWEHSKKASKEFLSRSVLFELKNKSKNPIEIIFKQTIEDEAGQLSTKPLAVVLAPNGDAIRISNASDFTLQHPIYLTISEQIPHQINPTIHQFLFPTNVQQIMIKWEDGKLQAQKGSLFGYAESGVPLKGNVRTQDIVRLR